jgi:hypothetical protein
MSFLNRESFNRTVFFNGTSYNGTFFNSTFLNNTDFNGTYQSCAIVYIKIGTVSSYQLSNGNTLIVDTSLRQTLPWPMCPPPPTAEQLAEMEAKKAEMLAEAGRIAAGILGGIFGGICLFCLPCCINCCCETSDRQRRAKYRLTTVRA